MVQILGSLENDAFAVRYFVKNGIDIMLAQSYAKNMGLYGKHIKYNFIIIFFERFLSYKFL